MGEDSIIHVPWDEEIWNMVKGETIAEYGDVKTNDEIQKKILEIVREHRQ